jgi:hypothetical protein
MSSASQAKVMARNRFGWSDYSQIFSFLTGKNGEFLYVFLIKNTVCTFLAWRKGEDFWSRKFLDHVSS